MSEQSLKRKLLKQHVKESAKPYDKALVLKTKILNHFNRTGDPVLPISKLKPHITGDPKVIAKQFKHTFIILPDDTITVKGICNPIKI